MRLRFDPAEDRIAVLLSADRPRAFWLTRRQCVALLNACRQVQEKAKQLPVGAASRKARTAIRWPAEIELVTRLRVRRLTGGLRLVFTAGERSVRVDLAVADLSAFVKSLLQLTERARWDLDVALARLAERPVPRPTLH